MTRISSVARNYQTLVRSQEVVLPPLALLMDRVTADSETGCWLWQGTRTPSGYGRFTYRGVARSAYSWMWLAMGRPLHAGLELDHLCRTRSCVNPSHLEEVTHAENIRRGVMATGKRNSQGRKTHCPAGHAYEGENLYVYAGRRYCRTCNQRRVAEHRRRKSTVA